MDRAQPTPVELGFYGYADESITNEVIAFGSAVFSIDTVAEAEAILARAKESIGLSHAKELHSKVMFHAPARRNTAWEKIPPPCIFSMVMRLCEELKKVGERPIVFMAPVSKMTFPGFNGAKDSGTRLEEKGIASLGFQSIHVHLVQRYGYGGIKTLVDPDKSKIPWLGGQRRQANSTRSVFIDMGSGIEPPRLVPEINNRPKPKKEKGARLLFC